MATRALLVLVLLLASGCVEVATGDTRFEFEVGGRMYSLPVAHRFEVTSPLGAALFRVTADEGGLTTFAKYALVRDVRGFSPIEAFLVSDAGFHWLLDIGTEYPVDAGQDVYMEVGGERVSAPADAEPDVREFRAQGFAESTATTGYLVFTWAGVEPGGEFLTFWPEGTKVEEVLVGYDLGLFRLADTEAVVQISTPVARLAEDSRYEAGDRGEMQVTILKVKPPFPTTGSILIEDERGHRTISFDDWYPVRYVFTTSGRTTFTIDMGGPHSSHPDVYGVIVGFPKPLFPVEIDWSRND